MRTGYQSGQGWGAGACHLILCFFLLIIPGLAAARPYRVLLVHSFGRDYAPFDAFTRNFRNMLAKEMGESLVFYDVNLESALVTGESSEAAFTTYLGRLFDEQPPDLVVPIGGPAARFAQRQRSHLFPNKPMLIAAADERHVQSSLFASNDTAVCCRNEPASVIAGILRVLPATTNIAVIIGDSPPERFWELEVQRDFQRFTNRVGFTYYNHLSFSQIQREASHLPPRSAIFFGLLYVDGQGVPFAGQQVLSTLHNTANAPIFGSYDTQLGIGVAGGPMLPISKMAATTADAAVRILRGEPASNIKVPAEVPATPVYDWRELKRWGIDEKQLPPGSSVRFRERTFWQLYKGWVLLGIGIFCAALVGLNLRHALQLKAAEQEQTAFTRQLLLSQEEERKRIAGELHDGLGQTLVLLKNQLGLLSRKIGQSPVDALKSVEGLVGRASQALCEVRAISQALRPVALEQIGITGALEWMARQAAESSTTKFSVEIEDVDGVLAPGLEINLYRIVQEGLNNVLKHAHANHVNLEIKRLPDKLSISILDDGIGFDTGAPRDGNNRGSGVSLGLVSMTERAKLLGGALEIKSTPDTGTRLDLTIPVKHLGNGSKHEHQATAKSASV